MAEYINPEKFWGISFLGLAFPFLLSIVIFVFIFWIIVRIRFAIVPLIALMISAPVLMDYFSFGFNKHNPKKEIFNINIMSYNVRNFDLYNWATGLNTRRDMMLFISDQTPDIANFQEFYTQDKGDYNNVGTLRIKSGFDYQNVYINKQLKDGQKWGLATFSRYKIINKGVVPFSMATKNACIFSDIDINGKVIRVYNAHLQSLRFGRKDYEYIEEVQDSATISPQSNRAILSKIKKAFVIRAKQVKSIKEHIAQSPYPVVLTGDFNDTPNSYAYYTLSQILTDSFIESSWGLGPTYNGFLPIFRIDYILHDSNFFSFDYSCVKKNYSDHYPISVKLGFK
jgi:endonuclease/exonuclease/phosphatase family metal-dependent hydrolase